MALAKTGYLLQVAPFPQGYSGTPAEFSAELVRRSRIVAPEGFIATLYTGVSEPSSNVGPWLKGKQWWVWDADTSGYVPQDLSESETDWFQLGDTTPLTAEPPVWLRTVGSRLVGVYYWNGSAWEPNNGIVLSGPTSLRPTQPLTFQQYYDSDISALIWWERAEWRTVAGIPGDVKHVAFETLTEALTRNPGWSVFGSTNQALRGRLIAQATKDAGTSPETVLPVADGVTERGAFEVWGDGTSLRTATDAPKLLYPVSMALWTLVKN